MAVGPVLTELLRRYGLESLTNWAALLIQRNASPEEIEVELYKRPEFRTRFPAIFAREKTGLPPLSVDEYLSYESFASQTAKAFGVTLNKTQIDSMLSVDVSTAELQDRLGLAAQAVYQSDRLTREELTRLYDIGTGDLINYWLDPKEQLPLLQRRFATAQISGEARRTGYEPQLGRTQLEYLYGRGITGENAAEAFGQLVEAEELFEAVDETEQDIGVEEQLRLITGDVDIQRQVEQRAEKRVAKFEEGGGFATGREGLAGLGSAAR